MGIALLSSNYLRYSYPKYSNTCYHHPPVLLSKMDKALTILVIFAIFSCTEACPRVLEIKFQELKNATINDSAYLIDIRHPDVVAKEGKIRHSINLHFSEADDNATIIEAFRLSNNEFKERFGRDKPNKNDTIVTYGSKCGDCKAFQSLPFYAASFIVLTNNSFHKEVRFYSDGFEDWVENGGSIIKNNEDSANIFNGKSHLGGGRSISNLENIGDFKRCPAVCNFCWESQ